jgi:hypothetical protein
MGDTTIEGGEMSNVDEPEEDIEFGDDDPDDAVDAEEDDGE